MILLYIRQYLTCAREEVLVRIIDCPPDRVELGQLSLVHSQLVHVDGLVLDAENGQPVLVQVESLVVTEEYLVGVECQFVDQGLGVDVHHVDGVVFQGVAGIGGDALVV